MMERKLKLLFDYQKFERNAKLDALIHETEDRYAAELSDEDLSLAAGGVQENTDPTVLKDR